MRHSVNRPPTPDARDDQEKEPTFQEIINIKGSQPEKTGPKNNKQLEGLKTIIKNISLEVARVWVPRQLIESGEKERLMELLRERLIECGWKDEMKALCRAFIKKKGRNNVTVDDLIHLITPKGRASVPDYIKAELLQRIQTFLVSAAL